ncbi:MAG: hypothetical protein M3154_10165, partial [Candidatus Eremiobacteraeota bacterium]|nr:hypothetical protein [Candidatus Eremiobacteraeota bacterium]
MNLARKYNAVDHALAALITLSGHWPLSNSTTALNLLALAHRVAPSADRSLDKFVGRASLRCVQQGLKDPLQLISEEAANILGGLGKNHFAAATFSDVSEVRR